ncbi:MAG: hypothetical protein ACKOF9_16415 [Burkholderiales bacterium]
MTNNSTSPALPEALRELTPQDQEEHAKKRLRELIEDGLSSGDPEFDTKARKWLICIGCKFKLPLQQAELGVG